MLTQQQTAAYIADVTLGLRGMADKAELSFLTCLLDMAVHEACSKANSPAAVAPTSLENRCDRTESPIVSVTRKVI